VVEAAPFTNDANYYHEARRIAESIPGAVWANQFENTVNRDTHERTTGPEIIEQMGGKLDAFVAAAGTGGHVSRNRTRAQSARRRDSRRAVRSAWLVALQLR
jgi:cysteine synthase A